MVIGEIELDEIEHEVPHVKSEPLPQEPPNSDPEDVVLEEGNKVRF
jgi:hypothetical protein